MFIHRTVVSFSGGLFVCLLNAIELTSFCCECIPVRSVMSRLGLWHTKSSCIRPQTSTVRMIEKACNTSEGRYCGYLIISLLLIVMMVIFSCYFSVAMVIHYD